MNVKELWKYKRKESITLVALIVLAAMLNGASGAHMLTKGIKHYYKKNKKKQTVKDIQESYCRTMLYRLSKDGLVMNKNKGSWNITERGKKLIQVIMNRNISKPRASQAESDTIVIFDIPEKESGKRKQLRYELAARGFFALQKSVWLGKEPLDENFIDFLKTREITDCVHIFSINKRGTI